MGAVVLKWWRNERENAVKTGVFTGGSPRKPYFPGLRLTLTSREMRSSKGAENLGPRPSLRTARRGGVEAQLAALKNRPRKNSSDFLYRCVCAPATTSFAGSRVSAARRRILRPHAAPPAPRLRASRAGTSRCSGSVPFRTQGSVPAKVLRELRPLSS